MCYNIIHSFKQNNKLHQRHTEGLDLQGNNASTEGCHSVITFVVVLIKLAMYILGADIGAPCANQSLHAPWSADSRVTPQALVKQEWCNEMKQ